MKTNFNIRFVFLLAVLAGYAGMKAYSQDFPTYFDLNKYDEEHGTNGRLFLINTNNTPVATENKAYIFAANVNGAKKDLMRLTSGGITTFQSPSNSFVKLDFYANNGWQGYLLGVDKMMQLTASETMKLGIDSKRDMIHLTEELTSINTRLDIENEGIGLWLGSSTDTKHGWIGTSSDHPLVLGSHLHGIMQLDATGHVYINIMPEHVRQELKDKFRLFVPKGILTEDLAIAPTSTWADYVFNAEYRLKPIEEVKEFIRTNQHLPDVPSAETIKKEGYSQHDMNKTLLQKIEELTLYVIKQNEQIDRQDRRIRELEAQLP